MSRTKRVGLLMLWLVLATVPCLYLSAWHHAPLRGPEPTSAVPEQDSNALEVFHFLVSDCPCSDSVLRQLTQRQPTFSCTEKIALIGASETAAPNNNWTYCDVAETKELVERYGIQGGPWLLVCQGDRVLYSGGYSAQRPGKFVQSLDKKIIKDLLKLKQVEAYPAFGCVVGQSLREQIDPLSIKYAEGN